MFLFLLSKILHPHKMKKIQVGFLMSYDYHLLKTSIPAVYETADSIFIALDENFKTWTGGNFEVDPEFFNWLEQMDVDKKVQIYRNDFYNPQLTAMQNEVRERHLLALEMGIGNWLVQVDCDEYFVDFNNFVKDLRKLDPFLDHPKKNKIQICGFTVNLYKYLEEGILYVDKARNQKYATNYPNYKVGRNTGERVIYTKNLLLHECVSRTETQIREKFSNWGHSDEVDTEDFLEKWRTVSKDNYRNYQNFFYLEPEKWKSLEYVAGSSLEEIRENINFKTLMPSDFFIWKKNFGQWFKFLFR